MAHQEFRPAQFSGFRILRLNLALVLASLCGCSDSQEHGHPPGEHGGIIVSVGRDHYHAEALFTDDREMRLYMLGQDESEVVAVEQQDIAAFLRSEGDAVSRQIVLRPQPQEGDPDGTTSLFVTQLPEDLGATTLLVQVPTIRIAGKRYRFSFFTTDPIMPRKITDQEERELYLSPGGLYTAEDIGANGSMTASEKYTDFRSTHDMHPESGDRICPITHTKANANCIWIIGGQRYEFCCPPCIDEFLTRAKERPQEVQPPSHYVQQ